MPSIYARRHQNRCGNLNFRLFWRISRSFQATTGVLAAVHAKTIMTTPSNDSLQGCRAYLRAHALWSGAHRVRLPLVTLSREAGAGAETVARLLVDLLNERLELGTPPWTVFDKNLVEKALEDHELPGALKRFMTEDVAPFLTDTVEELLGLHPSAWTLVQHTTETIVRLARLGNAVVVGRAANIITAKFPNTVHVRFIAPVDARARHLSKVKGFTHEEALDYIRQTDRARRRYVQRYFDAANDDPAHYTMVLNTGRLSFQGAAHLIADAVHSLSASTQPV